jgi:hypothetical protein
VINPKTNRRLDRILSRRSIPTVYRDSRLVVYDTGVEPPR